ncbi:MAG: ATP-binding protein [Acidobacteria bacterium]|nr:ATP-binding protein [Acidobacteriota bacterium]
MSRTPFDDLPRTPGEHFRLHFFAAVARVLEEAARAFGSLDAAQAELPFIAGYRSELTGCAAGGADARAWWRASARRWEMSARTHLPLRAIQRTAGLSDDSLSLVVCAGLVEEDARFGQLFEALQGATGQRRPTVGLFSSWRHDAEGGGDARTDLRRLRECGLVRFARTDAPRSEWAVEVPHELWDLLRGGAVEEVAPWARYRAPDSHARLDAIIAPPASRARLEQIPPLLASEEAGAVVVRGASRNGRRTVVGALARALGMGTLEVEARAPSAGDTAHADGDSAQVDEGRWRAVGALATCLNAVPVVAFDLAPGETVSLPPLACHAGALAVVLGRHGGVAGVAVGRAITINVEMPARAERVAHWREALGARAGRELDEIAEQLRLTGGNVRRAARLACVNASLEGREEVRLADVRRAARALSREGLETLAARVETEGDWDDLAVCAETIEELRNLESRCRNRERLPSEVGACLGSQLNGGVRALFCGASGAGKTLAARLLAASLEKDLYRLDLSAVVNKYIGETEKNLSRLFSRAEELDVILLLDEGDALLTQRTDVSNANDRYANLETNYLLQRLESYEGVLVVTTNAGDRIDAAFRRRMDVCVNFGAPDAAERRAIWQMHLPASHAVSRVLLDEAAQRCELTGGQIRNAVLHAAALALEGGGTISDEHLESAVRREYRKAGAVCPLREVRLARLASSSRW